MGNQPPSPERGEAPSPVFGPFLLWPNGWMHRDATYYGCRPQPRGLCVRWRTSAPSPIRGRSPQIFGGCLLWPNGWMDQDATWHEGRPQPRRLPVRWGLSPLSTKESSPLPIFGPFLLWPNGWMHQDPTWYGCRPQPRGLCVRWRTSPPLQKGGRAPKFSAHVYCFLLYSCEEAICLRPDSLFVF